jgi:hypothetical protein
MVESTRRYSMATIAAFIMALYFCFILLSCTAVTEKFLEKEVTDLVQFEIEKHEPKKDDAAH